MVHCGFQRVVTAASCPLSSTLRWRPDGVAYPGVCWPKPSRRIRRRSRRVAAWSGWASCREGAGVDQLAGRWRIVAMELWDADAIDLVEPGFIEFARGRSGRLAFIAVDGDWTVVRECATGVRASSSRGRAATRATRSAGGAGRSSPARTLSRGASSSTSGTTPASRRRERTLCHRPPIAAGAGVDERERSARDVVNRHLAVPASPAQVPRSSSAA
jgi:hypothetical protein